MNSDVKKKRIKTYLLQILSFVLTIGILSIIGFIIPLRPSYSETEKRELAKFPEFTVSAFFNGSYFREIGDWYSDTFPSREGLVSLNSSIKGLYGIKSEQIHGEIVEGDDIPDEYVPDSTLEIPTDEPTTTESNHIVITDDGDTQSLGAVFVVGNKGYEYYNFVKSSADRYITAVNKEAELIGDAKLYTMIVPTSIAITLPDKYLNSINSSDQKKAQDYIFSGMSDKIMKVPVYDKLMSHRGEYIYFNTDHHWTALGAYYAYEKFAEISGITQVPLSAYKQVEYDNFRGSFYVDTGKLPELGNNPDNIIAYIPNENADMYYIDSKGNKINWKIINDVSNYGDSVKYSTFIAGDNSFTEITNPDITDGSSIVVVKESFGNSLVPFLVENYSKIYVIDYRYYKGSVSKFVNDNGVKQVLYINNVSAIRNEKLVSKLEQIL